MTKVRLDAIGTSTPLESNKSLPLLKGHVRFLCHRGPRCNVLSRAAGRMSVRYAGACSPASARRRASCAPRTSSSPSPSVALQRTGLAVR
jgi:hypothetical protein